MITPSVGSAGKRRTLPRPGRRLSGLLSIFSRWHRRRDQRRSLLRLDDRVLHDIGMKRIDIHLVAIRPFRRR